MVLGRFQRINHAIYIDPGVHKIGQNIHAAIFVILAVMQVNRVALADLKLAKLVNPHVLTCHPVGIYIVNGAGLRLNLFLLTRPNQFGRRSIQRRKRQTHGRQAGQNLGNQSTLFSINPKPSRIASLLTAIFICVPHLITPGIYSPNPGKVFFVRQL